MAHPAEVRLDRLIVVSESETPAGMTAVDIIALTMIVNLPVKFVGVKRGLETMPNYRIAGGWVSVSAYFPVTASQPLL